LGHEPAKMAANVSGQSMRTNRPNGAEKVHEMAAKHGRNREGTGNTPLIPHDGFEDFWAVVPRKKGKGAARAAYAKARKKVDHATLVKAMTDYAKEREGRDKQYTVHPATWLNQERWSDEPDRPKEDFHDKFDAMLKGQADDIRGPDKNHSFPAEHLPKGLENAGTHDRRDGDDQDQAGRGGYQQEIASVLRPRRFGGSVR